MTEQRTAGVAADDRTGSRAGAAEPATPGSTGTAVPSWQATPPAWRAAAMGLLAGGIAAGLAASSPRVPRWPARLVAAGLLGTILPVAAASRRPPIPPGRGLPPGVALPTFSVVVAARDEAAVVSRLVEDVAAQDHREGDGRPCFELVVVDDRSTDGTGERAAATAARCGIADVTRVIRRDGVGLPDGKGAALTAAQPEVCGGDVICVLDADARIAPWFLSRAAAYFLAGAQAVTARRRILAADSSELAGAQADEQTLDGEIQRGRWAMGGCSEFRGNGIMVRRDLLARVGGWRAEALTEDLDLSSRIAAAEGVRVAWAIDAEVWEEPVTTWRGLWLQRLRWAEGAMRRAFEHGPAMIRGERLPLASKLDFAAYVGQLVAPPVMLGVLAAAIRQRRSGRLPELAGAYLAFGWILAWDGLRWEQDGEGNPPARAVRARRALRAAIFNAFWLAVVPKAMWDLATRRGGVRYVKMQHGLAGEGSGSEPGGDSLAGEGLPDAPTVADGRSQGHAGIGAPLAAG